MIFGLNEGTVVTPTVSTNLFNESYDFVAMEQEMLAESAKAWNKIEYMTGEANCRLIHESIVNPEGVDSLLEAVVEGFFKKVKEFFEKLLKMVQEIFKKFMMWINSKLKTDKEFAIKYENEIVAKMESLGKIKVKGFTYTLDKNIPDLPAADTLKFTADDAKSADAIAEKSKEYEDAYRGALVGSSTKIEKDKFSAELYKFFRNGKSETEEKELVTNDVKAIFAELKTFSETKKDVEDEKSKVEKTLKATIANVQKIVDILENKKEEDKADDDKVYLSTYQARIGVLRHDADSRISVFTAKVDALKQKAEFGKKVALYIRTAKKQNNSTTAIGGLFSMSI